MFGLDGNTNLIREINAEIQMLNCEIIEGFDDASGGFLLGMKQ